MDISAAMSPKQVAAKLTQACGSVVAERAVRERARKIGACRVIGKAMMIMPDDLDAILEDMRPCPSVSIGAGKSGITPGQSTARGYAGLVALRTKQERSKSQPKQSPASGKNEQRGRAQL